MDTIKPDTNFCIEHTDQLSNIDSNAWNRLANTRYPFILHEYLSALEISGSIGPGTGWQAHHLTVRDEAQQLVAAMPLYIKKHSWGEYVFDWAWADAYHNHGLNYYPKLVCAIPYTPVTGPRLICTPEIDRAIITEKVITHIKHLCINQGYSSFHLLFPDKNDRAIFADPATGLALRKGCQYHWFNQSYQDFDHYLSHFNSRRRKNIKRERRRIAEQGIHIQCLEGCDISTENIQTFYRCYQSTYNKRGRHGYLTLDFFLQLLEKMPNALIMIMAYREQRPVAAALSLKSDQALYGRYWGCLEEYNCLHFEVCYYQGIDYCIARGLKRFDPGAQGEHKILRGFTPIETCSMHWLENKPFRTAVGTFLQKEQIGIEQYIKEARSLLPFKTPDD